MTVSISTTLGMLKNRCVVETIISLVLSTIYIGRGERIRTSDPLVPNQVLYQAEPLPELELYKPYAYPLRLVVCGREQTLI